MIENTLAIIKPDGVSRNLVGEIIRRIESSGLRIKAMKMVHLSKKEAEGFYAVHKERPFFQSLTAFMSEGPVVLMILSGENAIQAWRELMGATDPAKAHRCQGSLDGGRLPRRGATPLTARTPPPRRHLRLHTSSARWRPATELPR